MERTKQISVSLANKPGQLAHVCRCFADRGINIIALSVAETSELGVVRFVVDKPAEAVKMLKECPLTFTETDVRLIELPNKIGALAELAERLAAKNINIGFVYGSTGKSGGKTFVVLGAAKLKAAEKVLAGK